MGLLTDKIKSLVKGSGNVYRKVATKAGQPLPPWTGQLTPTVPYSKGTGISATPNLAHFEGVQEPKT